jgi:hypothetical protein
MVLQDIVKHIIVRSFMMARLGAGNKDQDCALEPSLALCAHERNPVHQQLKEGDFPGDAASQLRQHE